MHADPSAAICIQNEETRRKKVLIIEKQAETHKGLIKRKGNEKAHKRIFINF
jgi:hypothetical protein